MDNRNEWIYRIVFGVLWLVFFAVRMFFQRRVRRAEHYELYNEKQEKIFFNLYLLGYLLLVLYFLTPWLDFAHLPFPAWLRWSGAGVTALGIGFFGWAHQALGNNWTIVLALSGQHQLVTSGPYRWIRHPMYTGFFIIGIGFLLLSANWLVGLLYLGSLLVMYLARVRAEEEMMIGRFGDEYRRYMQRTGRLLPRLFKPAG